MQTQCREMFCPRESNAFAALVLLCISCANVVQVHGLEHCAMNNYEQSLNSSHMQYTKEPVNREYVVLDQFKSLHCCAKGYRSIEWWVAILIRCFILYTWVSKIRGGWWFVMWFTQLYRGSFASHYGLPISTSALYTLQNNPAVSILSPRVIKLPGNVLGANSCEIGLSVFSSLRKLVLV